jgi:hypothetical protein
MKQAYIVTSAIEAGNSPLTYSPIRSAFSAEERLRQTVMTIASLDQASDSETTIYLLDMSDNWTTYRDFFGYQRNLKFVSVKEEFPEIFQEVTTHANKSRCETLATRRFLETYRTELEAFDVFVKVSGRYFIDGSFDPSVLSSDKIFFKTPTEFDWQDWWGYDDVKLSDDNKLRQYCSVLFAWGNDHYDAMLNLYIKMSEDLSQPNKQHYDIETLLYFYTQPYTKDIIETNWTVYGWLAPTGQFVRQ